MLLCCEKDAAPASSSQHGNAKCGTTRDKAFDFRTAPAAISLGIHLPLPERVLDSRLLNVGCPTRCAAFLCKDFAIHCGSLLLSSSLCVAFRSGRPYLRVGLTSPSTGGPKGSPPGGGDPFNRGWPWGVLLGGDSIWTELLSGWDSHRCAKLRERDRLCASPAAVPGYPWE